MHGILRQDLRVLRDLASEVATGGSEERIHGALHSLRTQSPLWRSRVHSLRHGHLVSARLGEAHPQPSDEHAQLSEGHLALGAGYARLAEPTTALFLALRHAEPSLIRPTESSLARPAESPLGPAVTLPEPDERRASELLNRIDEMAGGLGTGDDARLRRELVGALQDLGERLLEQLDFEEEWANPVLRQWRQWPW